ncbi:unnamed protein product [Calypogeia fissa]
MLRRDMSESQFPPPTKPVPSLLNLSLDKAAENIDRIVTLKAIPDQIVAVLFESFMGSTRLVPGSGYYEELPSQPVPSLLNLSIDRVAANIDRLVTLTGIPDHIVAILFEKTLEASKLNDAILMMFLATGNKWVRKRVRDLGIRPAQRPVLPTTCSGKIL